MQSTRHDGNLAALHASTLPGYVLDVVVLTTDESLLATLRDASSPEHAIWHAPSADTAVDLLVGGRCGILIADLGTLRGDAASLLSRLQSQFPELVLMATGRRQEENTVNSLVSDGRVYRFLHKPISPARATLFIGAATRRYYEVRNTTPSFAFATVKTMARRPHLGKRGALLVALIAISIALLVWLFTKGDGSQQTLHAPAATTTSPQQQIQDLLARAKIAYASDRLFEPRGDNALEYYREMLALVPDQPDARAGVERVIEALEARVLIALQARDPAKGLIALSALQSARPDHPRLAELREQLLTISRSMRPAPTLPKATNVGPTNMGPTNTVATSPAAPPEVTAPTPAILDLENAAEMTSDIEPNDDDGGIAENVVAQEASIADALEQLELAIGLRERGELIAPPGNNAFEYMQSLIVQHSDLDGVRAEQQRLAFTMLDHARTSLLAEQFETAATYLERADVLVPGMSATQALLDQLQSLQAQYEFAHAIAPAGALKRTSEIAADYPMHARRAGIEGWVDLEFTVAPDGSTQDLVVRDAQPPNVFEGAALEALRRWRFEPILRDGKAAAQRAELRLRFELD